MFLHTDDNLINQLNHLKLLTGRGDFIITKIDKELPDVFMAAKYIDIPDGARAIVFQAQAGYIGLALAQMNHDADFLLFDTDLKLQPLARANIERNFHLTNTELIDSEQLSQVSQQKVDVTVLTPTSHTALSLIESDMLTAVQALKIGGEIFVLTHKKKGAERIALLLEEILESEVEVIARGKAGYRIYKGVKHQEVTETARSLRETIAFDVLGHKFELQTEPSLFSKGGLDKGTRFLLETAELTEFEHLLDVGCGWGAIGLVAATVNPNGLVTMVDIDSRATAVAAANVKALELSDRCQVIATNNISELSETFDLVLSNPPFHAEMGELVTLFSKVRNKMAKGAHIGIVVERTYVDKFTEVLREVFGKVELHAHNPEIGFYILTSKK